MALPEVRTRHLFFTGKGGVSKTSLGAEALRQSDLREHLGKWVKPFTAAVCDHAETAFYREFADLTEQFIRVEIEQ